MSDNGFRAEEAEIFMSIEGCPERGSRFTFDSSSEGQEIDVEDPLQGRDQCMALKTGLFVGKKIISI